MSPKNYLLALHSLAVALNSSHTHSLAGAALPQLVGSDPLPPGQVVAINASVLQSAHYSEPLTAYAVGRPRNADVVGDLDFLAARVPVSRRFQYKDYSGPAAKALESSLNNRWPSGGSPALINTRGELKDSHTECYGAAIEIDEDDIPEEERSTWQETATAQVMDFCELSSLRRAAAAVDAASVNVAKAWSGAADPDADVAAAVQAIQTASGVVANKVFYGPSSWTSRFTCLRAQNTAGSHASAQASLQDLAGLYNVEAVRRSNSVFRDGSETISSLLGNKVYMYRSMTAANREDTSLCKLFVSTHPGGGGEWKVYLFQSGERKWRLAVARYERLLVTGIVGQAATKFTVA